MSDAGWDRELHVLDEALHRLSAEVDAFLYGTQAKPPVQTRQHVEQMIRVLSSSDGMTAAERYRLGALQGRFAALAERWEKLQGEKEAGRRPGLYGHFQTLPASPETQATRSKHPGDGDSPNIPGVASVEQERHPVSGDSDRDLFERYVAAKKAKGEDVSGYRLEGFVEGLERERRKVRERFGEGDIVFNVAERDGRVRLIARKKPRGGP